jgi:hypothetical protein
MPPRRSTRSASVEVQSKALSGTTGTKRKRAVVQRADSNEDSDEHEAQVAPPKATNLKPGRAQRLPSSARSVRESRRSVSEETSRGGRKGRTVSDTLEKVEESDNEEAAEDEVAQRPVKKPRQSRRRGV